SSSVLASTTLFRCLFVVHDGGGFEPRVIQMGAKLEGNVVVLSGLNAGETIVTSRNRLGSSQRSRWFPPHSGQTEPPHCLRASLPSESRAVRNRRRRGRQTSIGRESWTPRLRT